MQERPIVSIITGSDAIAQGRFVREWEDGTATKVAVRISDRIYVGNKISSQRSDDTSASPIHSAY